MFASTLDEFLRQPVEDLDLAYRDEDGVAGHLVLGARDLLGPDVAVRVLAQPGLAEHGAGDLVTGAEDPDQGGLRPELDALFPGLLKVLGHDRQLVLGFQRDDRRLAAAQPDGAAGRVGGCVAAADDEDLPADLHGAAEAGLAEELQGAGDAAGLRALDGQAPPDVLADRDEDRMVRPQLLQGHLALAGADADAAADLDAAQVKQLRDLLIQDLLGEVPGRDTSPQHAARLVQRLEDHARVASAAQVVGGGEAGRAGADDGDRRAVQRRQVGLDRVLGQLESEVAEEALDVPDADRLVVLGAVARRLARVVADPAGDRRHRVVFHDRQVAVEVTVVLHEVEVFLDLLPSRARVVARRHLVPVHGPEESEIPRRKEPLPLFLCRRRGDPRDGQPQVLWDVRPAYGH
jgi:hypothetical protein